MAITATPLGSDLVIRVENEAGTGTIARRYQDIKPAAADADVYDVANGVNGLAKLQTRVLSSVERVNTSAIQDI